MDHRTVSDLSTEKQKFSSDIEHRLSLCEVPGIIISNTTKQERKGRGKENGTENTSSGGCVRFLTLVSP